MEPPMVQPSHVSIDLNKSTITSTQHRNNPVIEALEEGKGDIYDTSPP